MTARRILCAAASLSLVVATAQAAEVRGRVLVDGRPAAGIAVAILPFEDGFERSRREARGEDEPRPLAEGLTGKGGSFRIALATSGSTGAMPVRVEFSGGGSAPHRLGKLVDASGEDLGDVRLAPAAALAGRVVDARGGPVVDATVRLWAGRGGRPGDRLTAVEPVPQVTSTGPDGTFRFDAASDIGNRIRI